MLRVNQHTHYLFFSPDQPPENPLDILAAKQLHRGRGFLRANLPSSGTTVRVTEVPASLMSWTMSLCDSSMMDWPLTAEMRSPTLIMPMRSVGLPSMIRPILWGITVKRETRRNDKLFFFGIFQQHWFNKPNIKISQRQRQRRSTVTFYCWEWEPCPSVPLLLLKRGMKLDKILCDTHIYRSDSVNYGVKKKKVNNKSRYPAAVWGYSSAQQRFELNANISMLTYSQWWCVRTDIIIFNMLTIWHECVSMLTCGNC